jgi:hypothetical protein
MDFVLGIVLLFGLSVVVVNMFTYGRRGRWRGRS